MTPKRIAAGIATAGILAGGGTIATDNAINPYQSASIVENGKSVTVLTEAASSTLPQAGTEQFIAETTKPKIILKKWNGEVAMGVTYNGMASTSIGARPFLSKNVEWSDAKQKMQVVPLAASSTMEDGGYEINIILNSRPASNVFDFSIDNADQLDFFYQAPLWQEAGLRAPTKDCTDIDCNGDQRPENAVASYAVYYKTHDNFCSNCGTLNYASGKAYHIFRPKVTDANNISVWGQLSYSSGILSLMVPQSFLDTATYPITIDPTFGYTSNGASSESISNAHVAEGIIVNTHAAATGDNITSFSLGWASRSNTISAAIAAYTIVSGQPSSRLAAKVDDAIVGSAGTFAAVTVSQAMVAGTTYGVAFSGEDNSVNTYNIQFDAGSAPGRFASTATTLGTSFSPTGSDDGRHYSLFATYTAVASSQSPLPEF